MRKIPHCKHGLTATVVTTLALAIPVVFLPNLNGNSAVLRSAGIFPLAVARPAKKHSAKKKARRAASQTAPTKQIVEHGIRSLWEKKADPGMDGEQTVTIQSIQIGQPRPWTVLDGNGGRPGNLVWPAKVHWTLRTHYRTRTDVRERHWIVSCFKNGFNEWVVQDSGESGQSETSRDEPSTMH